MNTMFTEHCNLRCKYCFADDAMEKSEAKLLSIENLEKIIAFHKANHITEFRIIGGEPTLHPNFIYMLVKIAHDPFFKSVLIFSNMSFGKEILESIALLAQVKKINVLPNCNEESVIGPDKYKLMLYNIEQLASKGIIDTVGINIYHPDMDFDYIFDIATKYGIRHIRWSISVPNTPLDGTFNAREYFTRYKPTIMHLVDKAATHNKILVSDCNSFPMCVFSDEEFRRIAYASPDTVATRACRPVLDVQTNLEVIRCFGMSHIRASLDRFDKLPDLINYLDGQSANVHSKSLMESCKDCAVYIRNGNRSCGCLVYKLKE